VGGLCIAKASPNRRGADEGGGEVNGLNFITNLWIINTCDHKYMHCIRKIFNKGNIGKSYYLVALLAFCLIAGSLACIAIVESALPCDSSLADLLFFVAIHLFF